VYKRQILAYADEHFGPVTLAVSLSMEDMLLLHLVDSHKGNIEAFTLDTGRMFEESYMLLDQARKKYATKIRVMFPQSDATEHLVQKSGPLAFYDSIDARKACCKVRKIDPLGRALKSHRGWITGLRAAQSVTRSDIAHFEWDAGHGLVKVNPLATWSEADVWARVQELGALVHPLHERGFPSIGCAPCTRAVDAYTPGNGDLIDIRAGRWWWENKESKECGLHPARIVPGPSLVDALVAGNTSSVPPKTQEKSGE